MASNREMIDTLTKLHALAVESRNAAHAAYEVALKMRTPSGERDSRQAFEASRMANATMDAIYRALLTEIAR